MAKSTQSNGDYDSDFKRNAKVLPETEKTDDQSALDHKIQEYVQELLAEKLTIDQKKHPHAIKLLDQEISKVQADGKPPSRDSKYVDIYREKPIKVVVKVLVPVQEYPKFNFVGKILGPKGNSLKRLQEETMCKMAVLGRGSMRDRSKEEELRRTLDLKFAHLSDDLHVEISALGPAAEAHARIAFALAEIRKYLIPDSNDHIRKEQLREMESLNETPSRSRPEGGPVTKRPGIPRAHQPPLRPPMPMRTATRMPVPTPRVMPAKTKIMSILDRARVAMEESYGGGYYAYDDSYEYGGPYEDYPLPSAGLSHTYPERRFKTEYEPGYYREGSDNYGEPSRRWKSVKLSSPTPQKSESTHRYRSSPYSHSSK